MTLSDKIQLAGILTSTVVSIISITIAVFSLKQNNKMLESSSRPYISIYLRKINVTRPEHYIVVKNFGSSAALIKKFEADVDLKLLNPSRNFPEDIFPFSNIVNTLIAPNQSLFSYFILDKALEHFENITFDIEYSSDSKTYKDTITLNLKSTFGNLELSARDASNLEDSLKLLSLSAYDLVRRNL